MIGRLITAGRATVVPSPAAGEDWLDTDRWVRFGMRTVWALVLGLLLSATVLNISGAVVSNGTVTVESNYKTVQHLDGGIVSKILVKNGDRVAEGDVLVRLDDTAARANHAVVVGRVNDYRIQEARLVAERDGKPSFGLPAGIDGKDPAVAKIVASQQSLFEARRIAHAGEISMLKERVNQLLGEIKGLNAQLGSTRKQAEINSKELSTVLPLFEKGFVNQQRVAPLQREAARLEGEAGRIGADIAKAKAAVGEAELKLAQSEKEYLSQVVDELRKVQSALAEQEEQAKALSDKVVRSEIRAPCAGRVHALAAHTEGGVVTPASTILQVVPENERLIVEAQIPPQEVDKVRAKQLAHVRLSAFNSRTTPRLDGAVLLVSPAQITDNQGKSFFTVQVEIPASELKKIGEGHDLVPGMPAEVYIETKSRSLLSYFLKPLTDVMARTFKES